MDESRPKRSEKFQLLFDEQEVRVIDDWRFKHRLPSRAAAMRELIRRGLLAQNIEIDRSSTANLASGDFRVIDEEVKEVMNDK